MLSEVIIIGGTLLAFLSACGVIVSNQGLDTDSAIHFVYDKFTDWYETQENILDVASIIAQMQIYKGYLKISDTLTSIFSDFASTFADNTISTSNRSIIINGVSAKSFNIDDVAIIPEDQRFPLNTAVPYVGNDGYTHTLVVKWDTEPFIQQYNVFKDGVKLGYDYHQVNNRNLNGQYFYFVSSQFDNIAISDNTRNFYCYGKHAIAIDAAFEDRTFTLAASEVNVPSEPLQEDIGTYISPIQGINAESVEDYVEGISTTLTNTGMVSQTWIQATTNEIDEAIENTPPELDDYDFTTLGDLLSRKFPFSIPNDIKLAAQMLHYQAEAPIWTFQPLDVPGVPDAVAAAEVTIDLSDDTYAPWLAILRWGIVILYVAGLASATKNLIFE